MMEPLKNSKQDNDSELSEQRLQAVLCEYKALRDEVLQKLHHHVQIYSIIVPAITVILGYAIQKGEYDVILLLPVISFPFALRYIWEQNTIAIISMYLYEIESVVFPEILGHRANGASWVNWQDYYCRNFSKGRFYIGTTLILLVAIPFLPALFFNLKVILSGDSSVIPTWFHKIVFLIYSSASIYLFNKIKKL